MANSGEFKAVGDGVNVLGQLQQRSALLDSQANGGTKGGDIMGRKIICDRCGKECAVYGENRYIPFIFQKKYTYVTAHYDHNDGREIEYYLCKECLDLFKSWMKSGKR